MENKISYLRLLPSVNTNTFVTRYITKPLVCQPAERINPYLVGCTIFNLLSRMKSIFVS